MAQIRYCSIIHSYRVSTSYPVVRPSRPTERWGWIRRGSRAALRRPELQTNGLVALETGLARSDVKPISRHPPDAVLRRRARPPWLARLCDAVWARMEQTTFEPKVRFRTARAQRRRSGRSSFATFRRASPAPFGGGERLENRGRSDSAPALRSGCSRMACPGARQSTHCDPTRTSAGLKEFRWRTQPQDCARFCLRALPKPGSDWPGHFHVGECTRHARSALPNQP
jgi:hypothetical protein